MAVKAVLGISGISFALNRRVLLVDLVLRIDLHASLTVILSEYGNICLLRAAPYPSIVQMADGVRKTH